MIELFVIFIENMSSHTIQIDREIKKNPLEEQKIDDIAASFDVSTLEGKEKCLLDFKKLAQ